MEQLDHHLATNPLSLVRTRLPAQLAARLDASIDRAIVEKTPRAWCLLALQWKKPGAQKVFRTLLEAGLMGSCALLAAAAVHGYGEATDKTCLALLLRACLQHASEEVSRSASASGASAGALVARRVICAMAQRLTLDEASSKPLLATLSEGLRLGPGPAAPRSGLIFLEPLRRLALLSAAAAAAATWSLEATSQAVAQVPACATVVTGGTAAPLGAAEASPEPSWAEPLLSCVAILRQTNVTTAEFLPIAPAALHEVVSEARCCFRVVVADASAGAQQASAGAVEAMSSSLLRLLYRELAPLLRPDAPPYHWPPPERYLPSLALAQSLQYAEEEGMSACSAARHAQHGAMLGADWVGSVGGSGGGGGGGDGGGGGGSGGAADALLGGLPDEAERLVAMLLLLHRAAMGGARDAWARALLESCVCGTRPAAAAAARLEQGQVQWQQQALLSACLWRCLDALSSSSAKGGAAESSSVAQELLMLPFERRQAALLRGWWPAFVVIAAEHAGTLDGVGVHPVVEAVLRRAVYVDW